MVLQPTFAFNMLQPLLLKWVNPTTGRAMPCKSRGEIVDHEVYMGAAKIKRWALSNLGTFTTALHSDTTAIKS